MEETTITKEEIQTGLNSLQADMNKAIKEAQEAVLGKSEEKLKAAYKKMEEIEAEKNELSRRIGELEAKNAVGSSEGAPKTFNEVLSETIRENIDAIKGFKKGDKLNLEMKAVGDMTTANFTGDSYSNITTDFRQGVLPIPTERIWMRDVLPSGTTTSGTIWYPRHTGGEGSAAPWASGNKPQMDFDFDGVSTPVEWIAGYVKVPRQMLDDVVWLESFLRQHMLLSLKKAENSQILNGNGTPPQLDGIIPNATAYDGTYTIPIERIVDAGYGQVNTAYGNSNLAILYPRDAVSLILNKASGSGEYDMPPGTIGFVNNRLVIAGMTVVQSTEMGQGNFLVGDNTASQFVTRLSPELRMFEQNEDDAKKNLIMFRIEERAALLHYYPQWWVNGTLAATT